LRPRGPSTRCPRAAPAVPSRGRVPRRAPPASRLGQLAHRHRFEQRVLAHLVQRRERTHPAPFRATRHVPCARREDHLLVMPSWRACLRAAQLAIAHHQEARGRMGHDLAAVSTK
jgi:hypothetical protein